MGGSLASSNTSPSVETYFQELFAYCLSIGMSAHEFWEEDTDLVNSYVQAEQIRQKKINNQMWIQGAYIQMAIGSCLDKKAKYPSKPIPMNKEEVEEERNRRLFMLRDILVAQAQDEGGNTNGKQ